MKKIGEFLERFKRLRPSEKAIKEELRRIVKEILNIPDSYYELGCKNRILTVSSRNSALNNEFFLKKEEIQEKIRDRLGIKIVIVNNILVLKPQRD